MTQAIESNEIDLLGGEIISEIQQIDEGYDQQLGLAKHSA